MTGGFPGRSDIAGRRTCSLLLAAAAAAAAVLAAAAGALPLSPVPVAGPWSASPVAGNAVGHSLDFMMRVSARRRIVEVNMDYEGDVVQCTFRGVKSGNWQLGEHLLRLNVVIDAKTGRFTVPMKGEALNAGGIPGAKVPYELKITGRFTAAHAATGTIRLVRGCTLPAAYAPWRALG